VAAAAGFGVWRLSSSPAAAERARVGVVQASVPQAERFRPGSAGRNVGRHAAATVSLTRREPLDLVVWSETSVDVDLDETPALRASIEQLATQIAVPLLTGAPRSAQGRRTNSVVLFAPGRGLVESYAKQRLVPYSEYDPELGAPLAPLLGPVTEGHPYVAGREPTVFREGPIPFSAPVCFEITYPHLVRRFVRAGARLLVNLSNDAWFGPTGYPEMHLAHAIFRAVETRTWIVRGANTGISAAIDPAGRVVAELPAFEEGTFAVDVRAAGAPTLYARAGDAPLLVLLALALAGSFAGARRPGRARRASPRRRGKRRTER
jgi:apolipoprotein N-acyltransferase